MTELRNLEAELARFRLRALVVSIVVLACFGILIARLVVLQVARHEELKAQAESNRTAVVPVVPNRGLILDRNGVVLATNFSAYTLEITPSKVASLEQTLVELSQVVDITMRDRRRFKKLLELVSQLLGGGAFPGVSMFLAPLLQSLLWPVASILLLVPQRRAPDRDANRPL